MSYHALPVEPTCIIRAFIWAAIPWIAVATSLCAAALPEKQRAEPLLAKHSSGKEVLSPSSTSLGMTPGRLAFRRLFVPETQLAEWPIGGRRYLPLEASRFERLVTAAHQVASGVPADNQPLLLKATYQARLTDNDLLEGTADLQIAQRSGAAAILPLEPCSLALAQPRWVPPDGDPAVLGQFAGHPFGLLVDRSGVLNVDWSLRGNRNAEGDLVFPLLLPAGPVKHVQLTLPKGLIPLTDHGLVRKTSEPDAVDSVWRIELGSQHSAVLQIASESATAVWRRRPSVRQLTTYAITLQGIELTSQWTVTGVGMACHELTFSVDPAVRIIAARIGEIEVPWSVSRARSDPFAKVSVQLKGPLGNGSFVVQLVGVAPLGYSVNRKSRSSATRNS